MRAPGARYRKPAGQITPQVVELDPLQQASIEEGLAFCRLAHQRAHEATAALTEALNSGQTSIHLGSYAQSPPPCPRWSAFRGNQAKA